MSHADVKQIVNDVLEFDTKLSSRAITARYIYQITVGCDDPKCSAPFCARNVSKSLFLGKKITPTAAPALACHLASSRGEKALCEALKQPQLPLNIQSKIDSNCPFVKNPPTAKTSKSSNKISKSATSLTYILTSNFMPNWLSNQTSLKYFKSNSHKKVAENYLVKSLLQIGRMPNLNISQSLSALDSLRQYNKNEAILTVTRCLCHVLSSMRIKISHDMDKSTSRVEYYEQLCLIDIILSFLVDMTPPNERSLLKLPLPIELLSQEIDNIPNKISNYLFISINSYLSLWPQGSALTSSIPHFDKINSFLSRNHIKDRTQLLPVSSKFNNIPSTAFYRFYSSLQSHWDNGWRSAITTSTIKSPTYITNVPGIFSPSKRLSMFRLASLRQMNSTLYRKRNVLAAVTELRNEADNDAYFTQYMTPATMHVEVFILDVNRDDFLSSTIDCISRAILIENAIRRPIKVRFGATELGIDQGGVQIEFFQALGTHLVFSDYGFFKYESDTRLAWFNPGYTGDPRIFQYIGILFGLALYNGCMVDIRFPSKFYEIILKASLYFPLTTESLRKIIFPQSASFQIHGFWGMFPDIVKSFHFLLNADDKTLQEMDISFTYTCQLDTGETRIDKLPSYDKYPDGRITKENVNQFVNEYCEYVLFDSIQPLLIRFIEGLCLILSGQILNLVSHSQLQSMIEGIPIIDVDELKSATAYDGFLPSSPTIKYFWSIVRDFDETQKGQLLEFVTGSKRIPVGGVRQLGFVIQRNGTDSSRIPSSSVCFARLLIPEFKSEKQLKKMLLLAIEHSQGFGLV